VRAHSRRAAEGLGEIALREAAFARHVGDAETCGEAGVARHFDVRLPILEQL